MNQDQSNVAAGPGFRRAGVMPLLLFLFVAAGAADAQAPNAVPAEYRGTWVPVKATCESAVRILVGDNRLTLFNGQDSEALGGIEMGGPAYFGPDYSGIMAVLLTEFSGDQPAIVTFNLGEKRGAAQVEFSPVMPGASNGPLTAYNAHISKLNLAKRFPLNKVPLRKCAAK